MLWSTQFWAYHLLFVIEGQRRISRLNRFRQRRWYGDHIYRDIPMLLKGNEEHEGWIHFVKEGDMKIIYVEIPDTSSVDEEIIKYVFDQYQQDIQYWSRIPRIMYLICFETSGCVASNEEMASCLEFRRRIYNIFTTKQTCPVDRKAQNWTKLFGFQSVSRFSIHVLKYFSIYNLFMNYFNILNTINSWCFV